ncbi:MAG: DUF1329 domain-containing protein [Deltaproteobacteria bacterium]|nr:DUF1329 domain-containing protein [Deltaproteobacteria bacterium]
MRGTLRSLRFVLSLLYLVVWPAMSAQPAEEGAPLPPAAGGPWFLPPEGACTPGGGLRLAAGDDAVASFPWAPGDALALAQVEALRRFLPKPLWDYRERFFYEGMRLEIGPCYRDYSPPAFFQDASRGSASAPTLARDGGLAGWSAGFAFPPDTIDPADPQAGTKWAWNAATRYQGAGFRGRFRVVDLLGRVGRAEPFEGEIFRMQLTHRADLPDQGFATAFAKDNWWVAGGRFFEPTNAREFAWRQYRNEDALAKAARTDDLIAYLPTWRRVRRIPAVHVEGLYMPSFSVGVAPAQQLTVGGGAAGAGGGVVSAGGVGAEGGTLQTRRSGFEGQEIRPLLWDWQLHGVQDLLAPINIMSPMYPAEENREFGPWGLSFASDRWDLRRALVLEGRIKGKPGERGEARVLWYFDLQTLVPLYYMAYDAKDEPIDVGVFASRWSEDRPDYPRWPDDPKRPLRVLDSMGAAFANLAEDGSWRRESWNLVATPPPDQQLEKMTSSSDLTKGR